MVNLFVEGPDAIKLLSYLGINSLANFTVNKAKQFVPCSYDGFVIGHFQATDPPRWHKGAHQRQGAQLCREQRQNHQNATQDALQNQR